MANTNHTVRKEGTLRLPRPGKWVDSGIVNEYTLDGSSIYCDAAFDEVDDSTHIDWWLGGRVENDRLGDKSLIVHLVDSESGIDLQDYLIPGIADWVKRRKVKGEVVKVFGRKRLFTTL